LREQSFIVYLFFVAKSTKQINKKQINKKTNQQINKKTNQQKTNQQINKKQ
jgi:hypothetical protein